MKNFSSQLFFTFFLSLLVITCTKVLDEEMAKNNYSGGDGCVYCHTNADRLKVLASEAEENGGAGGG
jgi:hypothetical protein